MTETNLTVLGNRTGNTEALETDTDSGSGVGSLCATHLDSDSCAYSVSPDSIFKANGLS